MPHRRLVVLVAALAVGVAACADGPSSSDGTPIAEGRHTEAPGPPPSDVESADPGGADEGGAGEIPRSPLAEILDAVDSGVLDDYNADIARLLRQTQEALARCMAAEGFEYVPREQAVKIVSVDSVKLSVDRDRLPADAADLPPEERIARYGYGTSTVEPEGDGRAEPEDPNRRIVGAMTVAERVAYHQALYGSSSGLDADGYPSSNPFTDDPDACWNRVPASADASDRLADVRGSFEQLRADIAAVRERVAGDPRVRAATEEWSECMATRGHPGYDDVNGPRAEVRRRARDLGLPGEGVDPRALEELRSFEISIALADHRCRKAFDASYRRVQHELEDEFVRTHRDALEQYRDAIAAAVTDG